MRTKREWMNTEDYNERKLHIFSWMNKRKDERDVIKENCFGFLLLLLFSSSLFLAGTLVVYAGNWSYGDSWGGVVVAKGIYDNGR